MEKAAETKTEIWSPKTVGWIWLGVAVFSALVLFAIWTAGLPLVFGWLVPAAAFAWLTSYSLFRRGTDGWGWIPVGLALALIWMVFKLVIYLVEWSARHSRYGRWD